MFGSSAVLVGTDPGQAHTVAARLSAALPVGVTSVVPGAASVVVHLDGSVPGDVIIEAVRGLSVTSLFDAAPQGRAHVVPVRYTGEDLAEVADAAGVSVEEVVARHTGATYTVDFLGFAPGFAYLSGLDPVLHLPRRETPRTRVPAGSVGIAGAQGCVYPTASPGGWNLLGVSETVLFDPSAQRPSLLAPGDTVRFEVAA